jgi:hypothetical protein
MMSKESEQFFFFGRNWFIINGEVAYKWMIKYTKVVEWRNIEEYLYGDGCKWKNKTSKI